MGRRASSLNNGTDTALTRAVDSRYDVIKTVSEQLDAIVRLDAADVPSLVLMLPSTDVMDSLVADKAVLDSLYSDKATLDSLFNSKTALDSLFADKAKLDSIFADKTQIDTLYNMRVVLQSLFDDKIILQAIFDRKAAIDSLFADKSKLDSLFADKATLDSLVSDKSTLDSLYADKAKLDSLYDDKAVLDSLFADKLQLDTLYGNTTELLAVHANLLSIVEVASNIAAINTVNNNSTNINTVSSIDSEVSALGPIATSILGVDSVKAHIPTVASISSEVGVVGSISTDVTTVSSNVTNIQQIVDDLNKGAGTNLPTDSVLLNAKNNADVAQLSKWEAEAAKMTADSYATEAHNVGVLEYTSNGDGTFSSVGVGLFSALHYMQEASTVVSGGIPGNIVDTNLMSTLLTLDTDTSGLNATTLQSLDQTNYLNSAGTTTTTCSTSRFIQSGRGFGGVALTINDGQGNANVTFNHINGTPEQNGNAGRIEVNTDSSIGAFFNFKLKSGVTGGVTVTTPTVFSLSETGAKVLGNTVWHAGNDGPSSGLNADLLDGLQATDFATAAQGTKADNALPATNYNAADVLSKVKTVDGTGSGLDADTLDGLDAVAFRREGQLVDGRDVAADGAKLDGIEDNATADQTPTEILNALKTVDVNDSGLNATTLQGLPLSSFFGGTQTWFDVTLSRDNQVNYLNTNTSTIVCNVAVRETRSATLAAPLTLNISMLIDGVEHYGHINSVTNPSYLFSCIFIVPSGSSYKLLGEAGFTDIISWLELK